MRLLVTDLLINDFKPLAVDKLWLQQGLSRALLQDNSRVYRIQEDT